VLQISPITLFEKVQNKTNQWETLGYKNKEINKNAVVSKATSLRH
jgi:hypothetical protein